MDRNTIKQLLKWCLPALGAALFVYYPITDSDIFWHLASGREIITQKTFFYSDPFSYTTPAENLWINLHWIFQLTSYFIYSVAGGMTGLLVLKAAFLFFSVGILFRSVKRRKFPWIEIFVFLTVFYLFRYLVPMRPVIFSLLFISLFYYLLEKFCKTAKPVYIYLLIPIQLIWTNSQGLYILGPVLCGCFFFGEIVNLFLSKKAGDLFLYQPKLAKKQIIHLGIILILLPLSALINPYGIEALLFPLRLFWQISPSMKNIYSANIIENTPLIHMIGTQYNGYVITFFFITAAAVFSFALSCKWVRFSHLFCMLCFTILAYMAQRNLILYLFALIPFVLWNTDHISLNPAVKSKKAAVFGLLLVALLPFFCLIQHIRFLQSYKGTIAPFSHPVNSTEYLLNNSVKGNIFNADRYGGYLLWKLFPGKKVFIDTRLSLRSRAFFAEYLAIIDNPSLFEQVVQKYNITQVVLPLATVDRYRKLVKMLYNDENWDLAYTDGAQVLFIADTFCRSDIILSNKSVVDSTAKSLIKKMPNKKLADEALFYFGRFLSYIENDKGAGVIFSMIGNKRRKMPL